MPNDCPYHHIRCRDQVPIQIAAADVWFFFRARRYLYCIQNAAHRTETRLKRLHYIIPLCSFIVWCTEIAASLYAALSREVDVMIAELTVYAAAIIDALYK